MFARSWVKVLRLVESRRNPHRSGEVFARALIVPWRLPLTWRNPHQSGVCFARLCRFTRARISSVEKPPPKWGGLCESASAWNSRGRGLEKPPPEWGGVCELLTRGELCPWPSEKPPLGWGGVCEHSGNPFTGETDDPRNPHRSGVCFARCCTFGSPDLPNRRNPHRSGCALRDFGQHCVNVNRKTPTEVGPPSLTTNFQCPATTIAHNSSQMVQAKAKPPARARGGRQAG